MILWNAQIMNQGLRRLSKRKIVPSGTAVTPALLTTPSANVNILCKIKKITQNNFLFTHVKYCNLANKVKFHFVLEKNRKKIH